MGIHNMQTSLDYGLTADIITADHPINARQHQDFECNFVDGGSITYLMGTSLVTIASGRWAIFWAAVPHHIIHIEPDVHLYRLTIPMAWFLNWHLPDHIVEPVMSGNLILDVRGDLKLDQAMFKRWCSDLDLRDPDREAIVMLELEARVRRLSLYADTAPPTPDTLKIDIMADVEVFNRAKQMAEYIRDYYSSPITTRQVAEAVDMRPRNARKLFQMYFQYSIDDYITKYRIADAQRLLLTTDLSLSSVASRAGFESLNQFVTMFKDICDHTPKAYRTLFSIV